jgi:hypothetical protein
VFGYTRCCIREDSVLFHNRTFVRDDVRIPGILCYERGLNSVEWHWDEAYGFTKPCAVGEGGALSLSGPAQVQPSR